MRTYRPLTKNDVLPAVDPQEVALPADRDTLAADYAGAVRTVEHLDAELTRLRAAVEGIAEEYADAADLGYVGAHRVAAKLRAALEG